jgi:hypothetical protein
VARDQSAPPGLAGICVVETKACSRQGAKTLKGKFQVSSFRFQVPSFKACPLVHCGGISNPESRFPSSREAVVAVHLRNLRNLRMALGCSFLAVVGAARSARPQRLIRRFRRLRRSGDTANGVLAGFRIPLSLFAAWREAFSHHRATAIMAVLPRGKPHPAGPVVAL